MSLLGDAGRLPRFAVEGVGHVEGREGGDVRVRRARIAQIAKGIGYQPNHAARALATSRAQSIGFVLSDDLSDEMRGWICSFCLPAMERACRRRNYHLLVSTENLSSAETFVMPRQVGQRRVDGLIFIHLDKPDVVAKFVEFGLPCVCLGYDPKINELIPTVDADLRDGWFQAVRYAAGLGHKRVGFIAPGEVPAIRQQIEALDEAAQANPTTAGCRVTPLHHPDAPLWRDVTRHVPFIDSWLAVPEDQRPSLIIGPVQVLPRFLQDLNRRGLQCPRDVSLIAAGNAGMLEDYVPPLTAVNNDIPQTVQLAVDLLVDHIESGTPLTPGASRNDIGCTLQIRESCAPPKQ